MNCTRCDGTGLLNHHQAEHAPEDLELEDLINWMDEHEAPHDVAICDCCGDGEGWYGDPGRHYSNADPPGPNGPYASNGGCCSCH